MLAFPSWKKASTRGSTCTSSRDQMQTAMPDGRLLPVLCLLAHCMGARSGQTDVGQQSGCPISRDSIPGQSQAADRQRHSPAQRASQATPGAVWPCSHWLQGKCQMSKCCTPARPARRNKTLVPEQQAYTCCNSSGQSRVWHLGCAGGEHAAAGLACR